MPIELTTGVPGAGKTLFTVAEVLKGYSAQTVEIAGRAIPRRLVIGGIPDLLLPHELLDVEPIHVDTFTDPWGDLVRKPGEPPITHVRRSDQRYTRADPDDPAAQPVVRSIQNWWIWCEPGDVIVVDECQTVFRPMPSGKRAPAFVRQLEVHRHYGVDVVLITQHPQLLHVNVRALVGKHRHVRRLFGRRAALVYEWDHCSPPDRVKNAATRVWPYRKAAFGLYKSAQVHTRQAFAKSWPLVVGVVALVATPVMWWRAFAGGPGAEAETAAAPVAAASAPVMGVAAPAGGSVEPTRIAGPSWPVYNAITPDEPYAGRALVLEGHYIIGEEVRAIFGLYQDGGRVASVTLAELVRAGYTFVWAGPCSALLRYGTVQRVVSCRSAPERLEPIEPAAAQSEPPSV